MLGEKGGDLRGTFCWLQVVHGGGVCCFKARLGACLERVCGCFVSGTGY